MKKTYRNLFHQMHESMTQLNLTVETTLDLFLYFSTIDLQFLCVRARSASLVFIFKLFYCNRVRYESDTSELV